MLVALLLAALAHADDRDQFTAWLAEQPDLAPDPEVAELAGDYRFASVAFGQIAAAIERRPGRVEVEQFGHTLANRPLWAFHVSDPTAPIERDVLVFAGIHALEWISTEVATDLLIDLVDRPVAGTRVTVIPLLNPDGRYKVEVDLLQGNDTTYRRGNQDQVDLNRDFTVHRDARAVWKGIIPGYYATSPGPLSQPETRYLDALAARECYARAASLHAFGGFFYYPWSGRWAAPPDQDAFVAIGRAMEAAQGPKAYKTRQLARWGFFFRAQGTEIDHLYGVYGTKAFLVELTRSGIRNPHDLKTPFRRYNPRHREAHVEQGLEAMHTLVSLPPVAGETSPFVCAPVVSPDGP